MPEDRPKPTPAEQARQHQTFLWGEARDAVKHFVREQLGEEEGAKKGTFEDALRNLLDHYCSDHALATQQVGLFLEELPHNENKVQQAFFARQILEETRAALRAIVGVEEEIQQEATQSQQEGPAVDNEAIRKSAGFTNDTEVADSSKTDLARSEGITENDIGESAREGVTYQDQTPIVSRYLTFRKALLRLLSGIFVNVRDAQLLERAGIVPSPGHPERAQELQQRIIMLAQELRPPSDDDEGTV